MSKTKKTNDAQMNEKLGFTLSKLNIILMSISLALIILGFILMTGSTTDQSFNEDIFSTRRITVAPMISFFGFIAMIFAILFKPKKNN